MPLTFAEPPRDGLTVLNRGLQAVQEARAAGAEGGLELAAEAPVSAMRPHPVYELGLEDLAAGRGLEAARLVAWRYPLVVNNQIREAAELYPSADGRRSRFGAVTTGYVSGSEHALALIDRLPEVQQGEYEIRGLSVPALYVMAFWLKDQRGGQDRLVILPPAFDPLQALRVMTTAEFLGLLHPLAADKLRAERNVTPAGPAKAGRKKKGR